jgi:hypothetical protein
MYLCGQLLRPAREVLAQNERDIMEITQPYYKEARRAFERTVASDPAVPWNFSSELSYQPIKEREPDWLSRFSDLAEN